MNLGNQLIRPQIDQIGTGEESQLGMFHIRHLVLWYTLVIDPKLLPPPVLLHGPVLQRSPEHLTTYW